MHETDAANPFTLHRVQEIKIRELLPNKRRLEASGVLYRNGDYFLVFDNRTKVARISGELCAGASNELLGGNIPGKKRDGFEGIAYNPRKQRFYLLVESRKHQGDKYRAEIVEYDDSLTYVKDRPLEFTFESNSKGFEAVAYVCRDDVDYVLALCEGNKCRSGRAGREPGGGRIQLFEKKKKRWAHVGKIKLPKSVQFVDYSAMAIDNHRVAVVSQVSSKLWIGVFNEEAWDWRDEGCIYEFPCGAGGQILYGNVEGVAWITPQRIVTVSDKQKDDQPDHFADKDQSIHLFDLPNERTA